MKRKVRNWYMKNFPWDSLGKEISPDLTFADVMFGLAYQKDIYEVIGVGDSIVRENIFGELSRLMGCSYDKIYYLWLGRDEKGQKLNVA